MKLLALLIGLLVERLATQLFHLRRLPWMDRAIDFGFRQASKVASWPALIPVILLAVSLVAPVLVVRFGLGDIWFDVPYLILAIVVLFFSLGPKDIGEDIDEYCKAIEADDAERIAATAKSIAETDVPDDAEERVRLVEESVWVQVNNRLFAVVFWFVLLGPVGAWAYRVTDLIRRRAVFNAQREEMDGATTIVEASETLHGWLACVPARLSAIGYAMAGSFDGALSAWRKPAEESSDSSHVQSERLLARVGTGALALPDVGKETIAERAVRGATTANGLVMRALFIWAAVIAAMTLYGWSV
jgi:AmpE protein